MHSGFFLCPRLILDRWQWLPASLWACTFKLPAASGSVWMVTLQQPHLPPGLQWLFSDSFSATSLLPFVSLSSAPLYIPHILDLVALNVFSLKQNVNNKMTKKDFFPECAVPDTEEVPGNCWVNESHGIVESSLQCDMCDMPFTSCYFLLLFVNSALLLVF